MRVAIYTAIFGGFDTLKVQPKFDGVDYLCFTDQRITAPGWNIVHIENREEDPRVAAKRFKLVPHRFLDHNYDISIWIDGSITIVSSNFVSQCLKSLSKWKIACMAHPQGRCIFQEARGCADMEKYRTQRITEQVIQYKMLGYPGNNGLAACGIIVRDMKDPKVQQIGEAWMYENLVWTYQDQISFPFVLWRAKHWYDEILFHYQDRNMFILTDHLRRD